MVILKFKLLLMGYDTGKVILNIKNENLHQGHFYIL